MNRMGIAACDGTKPDPSVNVSAANLNARDFGLKCYQFPCIAERGG
jgi:hypothetical protein